MPLHRLIHQLGLYCFSVALVTSRGYVPRDRALLRAFCRWNVHNGKQHATVTFVLMKGTANYCCGVVPLPTPSYMTLIPNPLHLTPSGRPHCTSPCNVPILYEVARTQIIIPYYRTQNNSSLALCTHLNIRRFEKDSHLSQQDGKPSSYKYRSKSIGTQPFTIYQFLAKTQVYT